MMASSKKRRVDLSQVGRMLVQIGFLLLFLFPLFVAIYARFSLEPVPTITSWLLAFDPALLAAQVIRRDFLVIVVGAPLLLLSLSLIFGRFFCGWICPIGTILDAVRPLAFWRKRKHARVERRGWFPAGDNRNIRYWILAAVLGASLFSLKFLGLLDPLVIFNRATTTLTANAFSSQQPGIRAVLAVISLFFLGIIVLEMWQPRFWCRNLCPLGAFISLVSRFSLLKRIVPASECTHCLQCQRDCPMNAVTERGASTDYSQCTFCLECSESCPKGAIHFGFAPKPQRVEAPSNASRRAFLKSAGAAALGAALVPAVELAPSKLVLRPPGALPEEQFTRTCILCQECIRVCPTGALRPALLESGLAGIGTPILVPRQGGCALNPSCPDLCAAACPVGAIRPANKETMKIGVAVVHREACLAWDQGAKCLVCVEACLNSAAIPFNGRVTVNPTLCTGCGRCESGCPVPGSAIRVEPVERTSL